MAAGLDNLRSRPSCVARGTRRARVDGGNDDENARRGIGVEKKTYLAWYPRARV